MAKQNPADEEVVDAEFEEAGENETEEERLDRIAAAIEARQSKSKLDAEIMKDPRASRLLDLMEERGKRGARAALDEFFAEEVGANGGARPGAGRSPATGRRAPATEGKQSRRAPSGGGIFEVLFGTPKPD